VTHQDLCGDPFPHLVLADPLPAGLLRAAGASWPTPDWPGWVVYDTGDHRKRAGDLATPLPPPCGALLHALALLPVGEWFGLPGLVPDLGLYGGGLHEMVPGDEVGPHRDADRHARLGLERVLSVVLFVHREWRDEWGGALELLTPLRCPRVRLRPTPGRLVAFDCRGAYHRVTPVTCPPGHARHSLALWYYGPAAAGTGERTRAQFAR
jgi:hypothetical protein